MIAAITIAVAALAALVWVLQPLRTPGTSVSGWPLSTEEAEARKRAALEAILDMEGELATGKLTEEDFAILRAQYASEAIQALKELDGSSRADAVADDVIEQEIARIRAGMACPHCGASKTGGTCERCHASSG